MGEPGQIATVTVLRPELSGIYEHFREQGRSQARQAGIASALMMMASAADHGDVISSPSIRVRGWFAGCLEGLLELARDPKDQLTEGAA